MTRRPVQFGLGDLETRFAGLLRPELPEPPVAEGPPPGAHTFVHTGEVAVGRGAVFTTVLGSCVAVAVWDEGTGVGGVNHFLLPDQVTNGVASSRFGNVAIRELLGEVQALADRPLRLRAKLFGGAAVLGGGSERGQTLGLRNVELARVLLGLAGIPVVAEDVGGVHGRKLVFRASDGAAWVKRL